MNTTLYFWRREKNQEVFMVFRVFGERNMVTKYGDKWEKKKMPRKMPKQLPKRHPLLVHQVEPGWHQQFRPHAFFQFWLRTGIRMSFWTHIEAILLHLESSGCLVFINLKKLKFQWLDKKLWSWEVCWRAFHSFLNISIILTLIYPWIVVGMRILLSSQWNWSQPVWMARSKLGFLGPTKG